VATANAHKQNRQFREGAGIQKSEARMKKAGAKSTHVRLGIAAVGVESLLQQVFRRFATTVVQVQRLDNSGLDNSSRPSQQT
jgi:hypothetical protein